MSSARYPLSGDGSRERTQLFANVKPYQPSQMMRPATPNDAGYNSRSPTPGYSDAFLNQIESQNDEAVEGLSAKVRMLKDLSLKIGDEVRSSSTLLSGLEERFESATVGVRSTVTRLIRTADRSGVSWRSWLALISLIVFCFWFVMLL